MSESIAFDLLSALNLVVLQRIDRETFVQIGTPPNWWDAFLPATSMRCDRLALEQTFPFLANFLVDAEQVWQQNLGLLKSGFWSEIDRQGQEFQLEATAICLTDRQPLLLIEADNTAYQTQQALIQTGRENQLNYDRFVRQIEKQEILLHCIFHDLVGQVNTFSNCLELLGLEALSEKGQERLEIGRKQVIQQTQLLREILHIFSSEVASLQATEIDEEQAPDLWDCCRDIVDIYLPSFTAQQKHIQLQPGQPSSHKWQVVGERSRLERILTNLVDNALRHAPIGSTVTLQLEVEPEAIVCSVDDEGAGVPADSVSYLFQRFFQGQPVTGKAGLGLYFCRITVERWGGTVGYLPLANGARFWFRLPKLPSPPAIAQELQRLSDE